jgi:hypothetical protein
MSSGFKCVPSSFQFGAREEGLPCFFPDDALAFSRSLSHDSALPPSALFECQIFPPEGLGLSILYPRVDRILPHPICEPCPTQKCCELCMRAAAVRLCQHTREPVHLNLPRHPALNPLRRSAISNSGDGTRRRVRITAHGGPNVQSCGAKDWLFSSSFITYPPPS